MKQRGRCKLPNLLRSSINDTSWSASGDHYLVQKQAGSDLWCVIDMGALDQQSDNCAAFRFRNHCEHLDLIGQPSA